MTVLTDRKGFTIIELIVVMVVLGILMSVGLFGLQRAMDGYNLAQASATSTQKAQNALDRIIIELSHITYNSSLARYNISAGTANSITYTANFGGADESGTIISLSGTQVLLKNFRLIDGVVANGLQFSYLDGNGNAVTAIDPNMRLINIALTVQVTPTTTRTFNTRVALQQ